MLPTVPAAQALRPMYALHNRKNRSPRQPQSREEIQNARTTANFIARPIFLASLRVGVGPKRARCYFGRTAVGPIWVVQGSGEQGSERHLRNAEGRRSID